VLTGLTSKKEDWSALAKTLPGLMFGNKLVSTNPTASAVHEENARVLKKEGRNPMGTPLIPHTDGYMYGDNYPDYLILLTEQSGENGGENFVVDGHRVLDRLSKDPATVSLSGIRPMLLVSSLCLYLKNGNSLGLVS
jgi:alpha-ketoglutarate-dependent taurine dioxygenase